MPPAWASVQSCTAAGGQRGSDDFYMFCQKKSARKGACAHTWVKKQGKNALPYPAAHYISHVRVSTLLQQKTTNKIPQHGTNLFQENRKAAWEKKSTTRTIHLNLRTILSLQAISVNLKGLVIIFLHKDTQYLKTTAEVCSFINIKKYYWGYFVC